MEDLELQVKRINEKLQSLLRRHDAVLKENERLKRENGEWHSKISDHSAKLEQLQQQVEILKASKGEMDESEKKAFEKRLGQYIREIDRCIGLLSE
jgi:chromosome segregation ATPase